ncbi:FecR family protein, partial [Patescibacteria group bacterium]|nr:FecR family protein [Patescibacteria group bacterium]
MVHESSSNLPYSPDTMVISAKLQNADPLTLTVTDENGVQIPGPINATLYPGYTITVTAGNSADVYFSDGSVSTLGPDDGDSILTILETSEVAENNENNIITKIKLYLADGRIWSRVVRLASRSEFNIETTSAIAGARGTEFGVDADTDKVTVYSGSVWIGEDDDTNLITGTPDAPQTADITEQGPDNIGSASLGDYEDYYEDIPIHSGLIPYIAAVIENNPYDIYVSFNGIRTENDTYLDSFNTNGFEIYGNVDPDRLLDEDVNEYGEVTDINYISDPLDPYYQTYHFQLDYTVIPEAITLRAFKDGEYSSLSWPPTEFSHTPSGEEWAFANPEIHPELALQTYIAG